MGRSRLAVLIDSEVARLRALAAPHGATAEEVEALAVRRRDFARRIHDGVRSLSDDDGLLYPAVAKVLARLQTDLPSAGTPDVSTLVDRVRDLVRPVVGERPVCAVCKARGGYRSRPGTDQRPPLRSVVGPRDSTGPKDDLCGWHAEERAALIYFRRWREDNPSLPLEQYPHGFPPCVVAAIQAGEVRVE